MTTAPTTRRRDTIAAILLAILMALGVSACTSEADTASANLSTAADQFEIERRVIFYNGITDSYMLTIEGRCSIKDQSSQLEVTCKVASGDSASAYKKHFLGLSDNVSYFVEQLEAANVDGFHYRVLFRPETIVPDIDLDTSGEDEN